VLAQLDFEDKMDLFNNIHDLIKADMAVQLVPDASSNVEPPTSTVQPKISTSTNPVLSCKEIIPNSRTEDKVNTDTL
jgi:hypothetical protein